MTDDGVAEPWRRFGVRGGPIVSARQPAAPPAPLEHLFEQRRQRAAEPFVGITTAGTVRGGLFSLDGPGCDTQPLTEAALEFLAALTPDQRQRTQLAIDAPEWRTWFNVHFATFRHGILLEDLDAAGREHALHLMRCTLSARGFSQARDIMRLNGLLGEVTGRPEEFGEWPYFLTVFGEPGTDAPWGWQLDGHHLNINCMVVDDQVVLTPTLMGSEPCHASTGPLAGVRVFADEERAGLDLVRSLDGAQSAQAIRYHSISPGELPDGLRNFGDGLMAAGAFADNAVVPHEGVPADALTDAQRGLLRRLIATYVGWAADKPATIKMGDVERHLDDTWFSWMGSTGDGPFYYRVHSPVVLIEFDHHPGIAFDNDTPTRHHVHSIIRTPNGGDYGADLLRQHHERFDHTDGRHRHRH